MEPCEHEGCGRAVLARGMCRKHYERWRKYGDPTVGGRTPPMTCVVPGCHHKAKSHGNCAKHAARLKRYGTTDLPARPVVCSVEGCERDVSALGLCEPHYRRQLRNGAPRPEDRQCRQCGKPLANHQANQYYCDIRCSEQRKYWSRQDTYRETQLKQYGITAADYERMLEQQGGGCSICGTTEPANRGKKHFCVDHDHATGAVRGLLCQPCNLGLGGFKDNPALLRAAIDYLGRTSAP